MQDTVQPIAWHRCSRCGMEIVQGASYWQLNGQLLCGACFPSFAEEEFASYRQTAGEEDWL